MTPLGLLRKLISGLSENTTPGQIAGGVAFGVIIGLVPKANLTAQILLVLLMIFRTNVSVALVTATLVTLITPLTDLAANPLGFAVLQAPALNGMWTKLYNMPVVPWTDFNNTIVMGSLLIGILLFAPVFVAAKKAAVLYDSTYRQKILGSKFVKALKSSWLCEWYFRVS